MPTPAPLNFLETLVIVAEANAVRILRALACSDAKLSVHELSTITGVHSATVRKRIGKLAGLGIVKGDGTYELDRTRLHALSSGSLDELADSNA